MYFLHYITDFCSINRYILYHSIINSCFSFSYIFIPKFRLQGSYYFLLLNDWSVVQILVYFPIVIEHRSKVFTDLHSINFPVLKRKINQFIVTPTSRIQIFPYLFSTRTFHVIKKIFNHIKINFMDLEKNFEACLA